ncbi:MAG: DUF3164 family protein [Pseudorhodobacter sp.]
MTSFTPFPIPDGRVDLHGRTYMSDARGNLRPVEMIKPMHLLQDEVVRKQFGFALALAEQISRFKGHVFTDLGEFDALMAQEYGLTKGGPKGNRTYSTVDGLMKVEIRIQDRIAFGPEMQIAKALFDECLNEWAADTRAELRSLVTNAFDTDKEGNINRSNVFVLLNTASEDPRWSRGQAAIRDAMHVIGSKSYIRFQMRDHFEAGWTSVTIDLANA